MSIGCKLSSFVEMIVYLPFWLVNVDVLHCYVGAAVYMASMSRSISASSSAAGAERGAGAGFTALMGVALARSSYSISMS